MLDLDGFKAVNDGYGHACGDLLLVEVAARLRSIIRGEDVVARLGGDEFVLILRYVRDMLELRSALRRVLATISEPYSIQGKDINVFASIGVTLFPTDNHDADTLLRHADQAMYVAKQSGRNRFHLFDVLRDREVMVTYQTVEQVRLALDAGQLHLYFQPKVNMRSGAVVGFEAILRWQHSQRGMLGAHEFLPQVEETDLIVDIGEWVMDRVMLQLQSWQAAGHDWPVSLNVAARHFQRSDFVERLKGMLDRYPDVSPALLDLEIVESVAIDNIRKVSDCLDACQGFGVQFSLGDFGTGHSSLSYLKHLRTQTIKIDRVFVRDMLHDQDDQALVQAMVGLARAFGRQVVAEGLESLAHGERLMALGCEVALGDFIAAPMPAAAVLEWVRGYCPPRSWRREGPQGKSSRPVLGRAGRRSVRQCCRFRRITSCAATYAGFSGRVRLDRCVCGSPPLDPDHRHAVQRVAICLGPVEPLQGPLAGDGVAIAANHQFLQHLFFVASIVANQQIGVEQRL